MFDYTLVDLRRILAVRRAYIRALLSLILNMKLRKGDSRLLALVARLVAGLADGPVLHLENQLGFFSAWDHVFVVHLYRRGEQQEATTLRRDRGAAALDARLPAQLLLLVWLEVLGAGRLDHCRRLQ